MIKIVDKAILYENNDFNNFSVMISVIPFEGNFCQ